MSENENETKRIKLMGGDDEGLSSHQEAVESNEEESVLSSTTSMKQVKPTPQQLALQHQIQAQLQEQLQAQIRAAAEKGQTAKITPEQIQSQAQAMVQAAAQAQAVVAAAKSRGDGLTPMSAAQIAALSQIQAQAIVNARPQTALLASGTPTVDKDGNQVVPTPEQIQYQINIQVSGFVAHAKKALMGLYFIFVFHSSHFTHRHKH